MPATDYQKLQKTIPITELQLCGLAINIASFSHLLKRVDFDAIMEQCNICHLPTIIKSKAEPATVRIKETVRID